MKIAFLVNDINSNGGIERVVITLANKLSEKYKYKVEIISLKKSKYKSIYSTNGNIDIDYLNYEMKKGNSIHICFDEFNFIRKKICKKKIDILISTTTFHNIYLAILKPLLKFKVIATHHEEYSSDTEKWNKLKKIFYKNLDAVILLTQSDFNIYKRYNKNCYVIPNAIPFKSKYMYDVNSKKIITVSRLSIEKSIDYSIRAFSKLANKYLDWSMEIVGDGADKERLLSLINELSLNDRIKITGFCSNVIEKYKTAAFTVLTSQKEGFGCVLIESNAVGVPVISFDNVGPKEIIKNGFNGFLVEKNNKKQLEEVMECMIANDKLRAELSKNSYIESKKYSLDSSCNTWKGIIESLILRGGI